MWKVTLLVPKRWFLKEQKTPTPEPRLQTRVKGFTPTLWLNIGGPLPTVKAKLRRNLLPTTKIFSVFVCETIRSAGLEDLRLLPKNVPFEGAKRIGLCLQLHRMYWITAVWYLAIVYVMRGIPDQHTCIGDVTTLSPSVGARLIVPSLDAYWYNKQAEGSPGSNPVASILATMVQIVESTNTAIQACTQKLVQFVLRRINPKSRTHRGSSRMNSVTSWPEELVPNSQ